MDIPVNAEVQCADGNCGRSSFVVLDPDTQRVTHLVVETQVFPRDQRLVPIDLISESSPARIHLRCTQAEMDALPNFVETEYIVGTDALASYAGGQYLFSPSTAPAPAIVPLQHENVPEGTLAVPRGASVEATDGKVGSVDEFIVSPTDNKITHLILLKGHLFGQREVTIPVDQIDHIADDTVYLKLDRHAVEQLPEAPKRG